MKNLLMLQNIRSLGANYNELMINLKNTSSEVLFIALTETWLKPISNLSTICQDEYRNILTCSRQRGKGGCIAIMCREKTTIQTFKDTNIPELQIITVITSFSGQNMLITVVYLLMNIHY